MPLTEAFQNKSVQETYIITFICVGTTNCTRKRSPRSLSKKFFSVWQINWLMQSAKNNTARWWGLAPDIELFPGQSSHSWNATQGACLPFLNKVKKHLLRHIQSSTKVWISKMEVLCSEYFYSTNSSFIIISTLLQNWKICNNTILKYRNYIVT